MRKISYQHIEIRNKSRAILGAFFVAKTIPCGPSYALKLNRHLAPLRERCWAAKPGALSANSVLDPCGVNARPSGKAFVAGPVPAFNSPAIRASPHYETSSGSPPSKPISTSDKMLWRDLSTPVRHRSRLGELVASSLLRQTITCDRKNGQA